MSGIAVDHGLTGSERPSGGDGERRFEDLVTRAERLGKKLSFAELRELARLYRLHSSRLAILRTRGGDPDAVRYLNALCGRAYTHVYVPAPGRRSLRGFFGRGLPEALGATVRLQLVALALLVAGGLLGAGLVSSDRSHLVTLVPESLYSDDALERLASSREARERFLERHEVPFGWKSIFGASLFVHNARVGLLSFASGILAGAPTVLLVLYNGLTLGAFVWIFSRDEAALLFWAWILPHAVPELLAILLCSTAGLVLGKAILAPGRPGTGAALRAAARTALPLFAASIPLLVAAALIESFVRESLLSTAARYGVAGAAVAVLVGYGLAVRTLARRERDEDYGWLAGTGNPSERPGPGPANEHAA